MSKTFKSAEGGFSIGIHPVTDGVQFRITNRRGNYQQFNTLSSVAAEQALAILEAAGVKDTSTGGLITHDRVAVTNLRIHIEEQERAAAEAEAQAKLEAEALELSNKYITELGYAPADSWDGSVPQKKSAWIAVARKAREMRAEK